MTLANTEPYQVSEVHKGLMIVEETLSDGSKSYDVMFDEGSSGITIGCASERHARQVFNSLESACFLTLY